MSIRPQISRRSVRRSCGWPAEPSSSRGRATAKVMVRACLCAAGLSWTQSMASHLAFARGVDWNANFAKPIEPSVQAKIAGSAASRLRVRRRAHLA